MDGRAIKLSLPVGITKRQYEFEEPTSPKKAKRGISADISHPPCAFCRSTVTPMWRKGPDGKGTLCNACGVRWSLKFRRSNKATKLNNIKASSFGPRSPQSSDDGDSLDEDDSDIDDFDDEDEYDEYRYVPPTSSVRARPKATHFNVKTPSPTLSAGQSKSQAYTHVVKTTSNTQAPAYQSGLNSPGVHFRSLIDVAEGMLDQADVMNQLRSEVASLQAHIDCLGNKIPDTTPFEKLIKQELVNVKAKVDSMALLTSRCFSEF